MAAEQAGVLPRWALAASATALLLWISVAVAGPSAAVPDLGPGEFPVQLRLQPSSPLVSVLLAMAYLLAGVGVWIGLSAVRRGWCPPPRRVLLAGALAVGVIVLLPPVGSADHLSYAAYGRIAALGGDPYTQAPDTFAGGADPVTSAVRDPWRSTVSVYGPVATALQALASLAGGDSVRLTVWWWQLLVALSWLAAALGLNRALRDRPVEQSRAGILWTLNPLLLTVGVGGAHADVLAGAAAIGALLLGYRRPFWAGVVLGVAVGTKLPYGAAGAGLVVAWWYGRHPGAGGWARLTWAVTGAGLVLIPSHLWAGAHAYDQTRVASRFVSLATLWRPLVEAGLPRSVLLPGLLLVMAVIGVLWWRPMVGARTDVQPDPHTAFRRRAAGVSAVLALGYLLGAPYVLPWYDLLLWGPFVLVATTSHPLLDRVLTLRLCLLALAYVPGLVEGMSPAVQAVTLGYRRQVGPWLAWSWLLVLIVLPLLVRRRGDVLPSGGA